MLEKRQHPAHVVGVVMGDEDGSQAQPLVGQVTKDRSGIARINHDSVGPDAQQPDIVIAKRGKRDNLHP